MLRMIKLIDCSLLTDFQRVHPLNRYSCAPAPGEARTWILQWDAYIKDDNLRLRLEGGASRSDSDGRGPAITGCDWRAEQGELSAQPIIFLPCFGAVDFSIARIAEPAECVQYGSWAL